MSTEKFGVGLTGLSCWKGLSVLQWKAFCVSYFAPGTRHVGEQAANTAKQHYSKSNSQPSVSLHALMLAFAEPLKRFSSVLHGTGVAGRLQHKKLVWVRHHSPPLKPFLKARWCSMLPEHTATLFYESTHFASSFEYAHAVLPTIQSNWLFFPRAYQLLQYSR